MNIKKTCQLSALVLLFALAACNGSQTQVQHPAPPAVKPEDTITKPTLRPDTDQAPPALTTGIKRRWKPQFQQKNYPEYAKRNPDKECKPSENVEIGVLIRGWRFLKTHSSP